MDDPISEERRREAYRNAASNLLAFGYEADASDDPISAALATLAARGHPATDPVILTMPRELAELFDWASDPSVIRLDGVDE